jgi:17beta-estradiol 17-dehydrogenase / 3beta-hydroxysteroid 3-dehydrogenase
MTRGMEQWRGKTALVTGASSGIGRAVALALAAEGLHVAACARRVERLEDARAQAQGSWSSHALDVRDEARVRAVFAEVAERHGGVAVLVNNAGLGHHAPLVSGATEAWRETLEVNVLGLSVCTREAVAQMRARGDVGHVVHISSMAAHRVPHQSGMYAASKFAVRALTEALRQELRELKSDIRVSAISPGFVETEFAAHYHRDEAAAARTYGRYPVIQPAEVADAVVYALAQPPHVQVHDVLMRPTRQDN